MNILFALINVLLGTSHPPTAEVRSIYPRRSPALLDSDFADIRAGAQPLGYRDSRYSFLLHPDRLGSHGAGAAGSDLPGYRTYEYLFKSSLGARYRIGSPEDPVFVCSSG